ASAVAPQSLQALPPVPQALADGVVQVAPLQQPLGQVVALQTQVPVRQAWPEAQAGPPPQRQAPLTRVSARVVWAAAQAPPAVPERPAQQPVGQVVGAQAEAAPEQRRPVVQAGPPPQRQEPLQLSAKVGLQAAQAAPPEPHALTVGLVQTVPLQQPLEQELA